MRRCDYPGCERQATCAWQSLKGRLQTCAKHQCVELVDPATPTIAWYKEGVSVEEMLDHLAGGKRK